MNPSAAPSTSNYARDTVVAVSLMVTVASGTTALVGSVTTPAIVPSDVVCADIGLVVRNNSHTQSAAENKAIRPYPLRNGPRILRGPPNLTPTAGHKCGGL